MNTKEKLLKVMENLPETRLCELLEREDWLRFGMESFAQAYGPDEPEYTKQTS